MTNEEAIAVLAESKRQNEVMRDNPSTFWVSHQMADGVKNAERRIAALDMALSALRPVSREQVEKVFPGCDFCKIELDDYPYIVAYSDYSSSNTCYEPSFCPICGKPLTDEAVEIRLKELEALKDGSSTD